MIIESLITWQKVNLACLQETKSEDLSTSLVCSLATGRFLKWAPVDSRVVSGRVLVFFWDNRVLYLVDMEVGDY